MMIRVRGDNLQPSPSRGGLGGDGVSDSSKGSIIPLATPPTSLSIGLKGEE